MSSTDPLLDLLVRWEELRKHGKDVTAEELCPDDPSLHEPLRQRIRQRLRVHALLDTGGAAETRPEREPESVRVAGYEILSELGRGGMGVVYKARQTDLDRVVALKVIRSGGASAGELARFRTEARALAGLRHPNILQIHELGTHDGDRPYLALEYAGGGNLARSLAGSPREPRAAAALAETLARATHAAHQCGIVHRDLKPANVLLTDDGTPKVADFGLAKSFGGGSSQTRTGEVMGTPSYMAPEQAEGRLRDIGPATDVYALGAILYELLTGRPPFRGATPLDTLEQVRFQEPLPPSQLQPKLPRDLETVCLKCLQKEAGLRYGSALALADDLRRFLNDEPVRARPPSAAYRFRKFARRNKALTAFVAALALGVAGTSAALVWVNAERVRATTAERAEKRLLAESYAHFARENVQRGDWEKAVDYFDKALAGGHEQTADIRVERAKALIPLNRGEEALSELQAVADGPDGERLAGPVSLWMGDLKLGNDNDEAIRLLRRAREAGLPDKGDDGYAAALLATTFDEALGHLGRVLAGQPYHFRANHLTASYLLALGRTPEARQRLVVARAFYPRDPQLLLLEDLLPALEGDSAASRRLLRADRERLGEKAVAVGLFSVDVFEAANSIADSGSIAPLPLGGTVFRLVERYRKLSMDLALPGGEQDWLERFPPLVLRSAITLAHRLAPNVLGYFSELESKKPSELVLSLAIARDLAALDRGRVTRALEDATTSFPEGTMSFAYGEFLKNQGRYEEAAEPLRRAADGPCLLRPVRRRAAASLVEAEWRVSRTSPEKLKELRPRIVQRLRRLVTEGGIRGDNGDMMSGIALELHDVELTRSVLVAWEPTGGRERNWQLRRAAVDTLSGAHGEALRRFGKLLEQNPKDEEVKEAVRLVREKLRQEADQLAPCP